MVSFRVQILVIIMCNHKNIFCFADHSDDVIGANDDSMIRQTSEVPFDTYNDARSNDITASTVKKKRTYRKRTTTSTSIRASETSEANLDTTIDVGDEKRDVGTSTVSVAEILPDTMTSPTVFPATFIDETQACREKPTLKNSILGKFNETFVKFKSKKQHSHLHTTPKKQLDRRRLVVIGGRGDGPRHQDAGKKITAKYTPVVIVKSNTQIVKKFTPKYSPIIHQSLFQQVIDLRKVATSPKFTKPTTTNKYEAKLLEVLLEYDNILSEERKYNETRIKNKKKEDLERELREASMQKSYLYKFVVTKVTTESWEKDLPKSSRAIDEEYMDRYAARINNEPIMRKHFFLRRSRSRKRIQIAEERLQAYRNATQNKQHMEGRKVKVLGKDDDEDDYTFSHESSEVKGKRRHFDKRKNYGKAAHDEELEDSDAGRYHGRHHGKANLKKSTQHLQANEHYRMMQEGWAQRNIRQSPTDMVEKRKEDATDIYEPDPETKDEQERMKSYDITSNQQFVHYLRENKFAQEERVLEAIQWVDRDRFAKDGYVDSPHNYGTNSIVERPSYQATCLEHLADKLVPGANVLDLGFGSGFMSCCMARMVGDTGHVTAVDHITHLVHLLLSKLKISYPKFYKLYKIMDVVDWDARKPYKKNGPYDVIHFGGGVNHIPLEFIPDLKINGSILVPVGPPYGPHILKKITLIKRNVYTIQSLAEVEALHFCGQDEQVHEFRQTYGHHFIKLFSLFYKPVQPFNSSVTSHLQTYKLPDG